MTDIENDRQRTKHEDDSSEDEEPQQFRSRVEAYENKPDWPSQPLYQVNEVVYIAVAGQSQPAGPYVVTSTHFESKTYGLKKQDTGQKYPTDVPERQLLVPV
ncbi:hypothetical protein FSARC_9190 [Fusarium sarcochroum]|uniref:Uncharacterized protein n=1 Tax=Fusarium sarcochroum TaxID=1208366 RepID=A0A8H4TRS2_9HYPO|nr:hypothetical protein FSARC_9190 [Fusarium sarcochroum]